MSFCSGEVGGEKDLEEFPSEGGADHETTEADQVEVVIFDPLMCREAFMDQRGADPGNPVGNDRCPDSAATDGDAPFDLARGDSAGQRGDVIGKVVVGLRELVSEIDYFMACLVEFSGEVPFQFEAAVVG